LSQASGHGSHLALQRLNLAVNCIQSGRHPAHRQLVSLNEADAANLSSSTCTSGDEIVLLLSAYVLGT
jgi:hypothetical protein